jgi:hypothetical protein
VFLVKNVSLNKLKKFIKEWGNGYSILLQKAAPNPDKEANVPILSDNL